MGTEQGANRNSAARVVLYVPSRRPLTKQVERVATPYAYRERHVELRMPTGVDGACSGLFSVGSSVLAA
jgi:hypothetical protein